MNAIIKFQYLSRKSLNLKKTYDGNILLSEQCCEQWQDCWGRGDPLRNLQHTLGSLLFIDFYAQPASDSNSRIPVQIMFCKDDWSQLFCGYQVFTSKRERTEI